MKPEIKLILESLHKQALKEVNDLNSLRQEQREIERKLTQMAHFSVNADQSEMKNLKRRRAEIMNILKNDSLNEDNYDSEEQKDLAQHYPNHLDEHFQEELRMLCKKYEVKDLSIRQMYVSLMDMADTVQQFYN